MKDNALKNEHVKALEKIVRAEREFRYTAEFAGHSYKDNGEEIARELIPGVRIEYPGLYPAFALPGTTAPVHWHPTLGEAYEALIRASGDEKRLKRYRHWRALFHTVRKGTEIGYVHMGDHRKVRLIVPSSSPFHVRDIAWDVCGAMGYRYNEKTRTVSARDKDLITEALAVGLFGDSSALSGAWL